MSDDQTPNLQDHLDPELLEIIEDKKKLALAYKCQKEIQDTVREIAKRCDQSDMCPMYLLDKQLNEVFSPTRLPNGIKGEEKKLRRLILDRLNSRLKRLHRLSEKSLMEMQHSVFMMNVDAVISRMRELEQIIYDMEEGEL